MVQEFFGLAAEVERAGKTLGFYSTESIDACHRSISIYMHEQAFYPISLLKNQVEFLLKLDCS